MPLGLWARGRLSPGLGVNHGRLVLGRRAAEGDLVQHRHRDPALQRRRRRLDGRRRDRGR